MIILIILAIFLILPLIKWSIYLKELEISEKESIKRIGEYYDKH